ncbi:MAG: nucleotidyltransferase family protein [Actinomycetota bacterium]|nr:nucleotidyltransferase family protein [Actinomycetota bacterium]
MRACIVLAGGAGRRMGGADKAALRVGNVTLLDRVLAAAEPLCSRLVVVGPVRATTLSEVVFTVEDRPGGGPVPAVRAGMAETAGADVIFVLAVDLPLLSTKGLEQLAGALHENGAGAAAAADDRGRPNPLLAAYRAESLRATAGPLRGAQGGAAACRLLPEDTVTVDLGPGQTLNVNTPADLAAAVSAAGSGGDDAPPGRAVGPALRRGHPPSNRDRGLSSR